MRFALGDYARKRRHVLRNDGASADVSVASNAAELVHRAEGSHIRIIIDNHVPGKRGAIRENGVAADNAIVSDVRIRHEQIVAADPRNAASLLGTAADRGKFSKPVFITNLKFRGLAAEFQILRIPADRA